MATRATKAKKTAGTRAHEEVSALLALVAEAPIHAGDREASEASGHDRLILRGPLGAPRLASSTVRGALAAAGAELEGLEVSGAQAVLVPLRSLTTTVLWVGAAPLVAEVLGRELPEVAEEQVLTAHGAVGDYMYLEELHFEVVGAPPEPLAGALRELLSDDGATAALVGATDFEWLMRFSLPAQPRVTLGEGRLPCRLWYEEQAPTGTVFLAGVSGEEAGLEALRSRLRDCGGLLQVGAQGSLGRGWTRAQLVEGVGTNAMLGMEEEAPGAEAPVWEEDCAAMVEEMTAAQLAGRDRAFVATFWGGAARARWEMRRLGLAQYSALLAARAARDAGRGTDPQAMLYEVLTRWLCRPDDEHAPYARCTDLLNTLMHNPRGTYMEATRQAHRALELLAARSRKEAG